MPEIDSTARRTDHFRELQLRSAKARSVRKAEDYLRRLVETGPPLSEDQRRRLAGLLLTGGEAA